jgi:protease I
VDRQVRDANPSVYDALVLPGGVANPDALRTDADAVAFVRAVLGADKLVAAICHAPWVLVEADGVRGRRVASWPSLRTDLENAGATWVDEAAVVDQQGDGVLITSRNPDDLDAFNEQLLAHLAKDA